MSSKSVLLIDCTTMIGGTTYTVEIVNSGGSASALEPAGDAALWDIQGDYTHPSVLYRVQ
jgi:hypothetical protein